MKLNLWMIANRLSALEPEMCIPVDAPADLLSARRAFATNCVYVYQKGTQVICDAGENGGKLIFKDMECDQVFEMVQFTFDFYREWQEMLLDAAERLDYKKIMDASWAVFHNPMILLDAADNALTLSEEYAEDEVNEDWKYLCQNGYSSPAVQKFLTRTGEKYAYFMNPKAKIYYLDNPEIHGNELSVPLLYDNRQCGRLNVVEYDRSLNAGDLHVADYMAKYLSMILGKINEQGGNQGLLAPVFAKLLLHQNLTGAEVEYWKSCVEWNEEEDAKICVIHFINTDMELHEKISIMNIFRSRIQESAYVMVEEEICFVLYPESKNYNRNLELVEKMAEKYELKIGISNTIESLKSLHYFYQQAVFAVQYGSRVKRSGWMYDFYDYAIDYILQADDMKKKYFAIQSDVRDLWNENQKNGGERIETLTAYLKNERSLLHTANELFIHRNTLVYRLKKLTEMLHVDLDDAYTRDYMKLSIRVMWLKIDTNKE